MKGQLITRDEFLELRPAENKFELMGGIPYVGGQPVDPDAFREAMRLLRQRPKDVVEDNDDTV